MNTASWVAFRDLLERCGPEKQTAFRRFLSPQDEERLTEISPPLKNPFESCVPLEERLNRIHYSWFITFLEPFSETDKVNILSSLTEKQAEKLKKHFKIKDPLSPLSPHAKNYLHEALFAWLISDQKEFIPAEFLPAHPLNCLLALSKSQIQMLVDYLGLHDLSTEIKHVIKADLIKKIQKFLSRPQQEYIKKLLRSKEPVTFARLNLDQWDGSEEKLKKILHHRGFNRLGKALFGCHPALLWHLCHRLDTGRTKILRKFFTDINNDQAQEKLIQQITELSEFIKQAYE